ncbi:MAG: hypothetical protein ACAH95_13580 [Fimbriimonas sp.]
MSTQFVGSDGWLLCSLYGAKDPCDRTKLNEWGDFFNHAIFNDDEVEAGIVRLQAAGYAEVTNDQLYAITPKGRDFVLSNWDPKRGHIINMFAVSDALTSMQS